MKPISYSTQFPSYHTRAGELTNFIEKIWLNDFVQPINIELFIPELIVCSDCVYLPKQHTVREGFNWKPGDWFVPKVWSGRPYWSSPIQIAEPIEVKSTYKFEITRKGDYKLNGKILSLRSLEEIARNDGLAVDDFEVWFSKSKTFEGQIICWTDLKY